MTVEHWYFRDHDNGAWGVKRGQVGPAGMKTLRFVMVASAVLFVLNLAGLVTVLIMMVTR